MHDAHIHRYFEAHGATDRDAVHARERRTWAVVAVSAVMMVAEIAVGAWSGSLALLADGVHMGTHVGAIGLTAIAYVFARKWERHEAFSFGTGKVFSLAGYTSALVLAGAAVWMIVESILRLVHPTRVNFADALPVAVIGLVVNLGCAKILHQGAPHSHSHEHEHEHEHEKEIGHGHGHGHGHGAEKNEKESEKKEKRESETHGGHSHDLNMKAAYLHVLADALTSVLAIAALVAGRWLKAPFFDPLMGVVGGGVILHWSWGLCKSAGRQLLDVSPSVTDARTIKANLEAVDDVRVADLHVWEISPGERGCIVKIVTSEPRSTVFYRDLIQSKVPVSHLTVEVHHCQEDHP